jgi:hypothetical protein
MSENPLYKFGLYAWGILVGVVGFSILGCLYLNIVLGFISLSLWLLPFPLAIAATVFLDRENPFLQWARVRGAIWCIGAMLCLRWSMLLSANAILLPTWMVLVLTFGFTSEPVPGPMGPEIHDLSTMMGSAAFVSFGGVLCFVIGAYNFAKERFGSTKVRQPPKRPKAE